MTKIHTSPKNYLFLNWKDTGHPNAGGAEAVTWNILTSLVRSGHQVTLLTAKYPNSESFEIIDGIHVRRVGGRLTHYLQAPFYYHKHLNQQHFDYLIEEVNTLPYLSGLWGSGIANRQLFYHQLAREVWFCEMFWPLNLVGFCIEPIYTFLQSVITPQVITVSESTRDDLRRFGFRADNIKIIPEIIETTPLEQYDSMIKTTDFTILFHSSLRSMKRPAEAIRAFGLFYKRHNLGTLWVSGGGDTSELQELAIELNIFKQVKFFGRTSDEQKVDLMQQATCLISTSLKEGWGLVVSEAGSQATPSICYNVDGLRDSCVFHGGLISEPTPSDMATELESMYQIWHTRPELYKEMCNYALSQAKLLTSRSSYQGFVEAISASPEASNPQPGELNITNSKKQKSPYAL